MQGAAQEQLIRNAYARVGLSPLVSLDWGPPTRVSYIRVDYLICYDI